MAFEGHIHLPSSSSNAAPSATTATPPEEAGGPRFCSQSSHGLGTEQRTGSTLRSHGQEMSDNEQEGSRSNGHDEPKVAMKKVGLEYLLDVRFWHTSSFI